MSKILQDALSASGPAKASSTLPDISWLRTPSGTEVGFLKMSPHDDIQRQIWVDSHLSMTIMLEGEGYYRAVGSHKIVQFSEASVYLSYSLEPLHGTDYFPAHYSYEIITLKYQPEILSLFAKHIQQNFTHDDFPYSSHNGCIWHTKIFSEMQNIIHSLKDENQSSSGLSLINIERLALNALWLAIEKIDTPELMENQLVKNKDRLTGRDRKNIIHAREYIHKHYHAHLIIKEIAKTVGISESKMNRDFKKMLNCSIHRYIINYRLQQAARLLNESNFTISEIAQQCGFSCGGHLSRRFIELFGDTPYNFRCR